MAKLVPAILTRDRNHLFEQLAFLDKFEELDTVQVDFEDGRFVPNTTALPQELREFPDAYRIEAHMMVESPQAYFHTLQNLGVKTAIVHYESFKREDELTAALQNLKILGIEAGMAVNPNTEVGVFKNFAEEIDVALLMGVFPGFQGRKFLPETVERVEVLRKALPNVIIEVDGGVKLDNFGLVKSAGADQIVVGSGIWLTPDPEETIKQFLKMLN